MKDRSSWSSFLLLSAISCGGGASHAPGQTDAGAGGSAQGSSGVTGSSASTAGKPGNGGANATGGSAPTGSGGMDVGTGSVGTGGTRTGSAGTGGAGMGSAGTGNVALPGACFGRDIDIPSVALSGTIKVIDATPGDYGTVRLANGSDVVTLGTTASGSYSTRVVPGTYDLVFNGKANGLHTIKTGVTVASSGPATLNVEIPNATLMAPGPNDDNNATKLTLAGKFTVDGQPPPSSVTGLTLFLRKLGTDYWTNFAPIYPSGYTGQVARGTYDISYLQTSGDPIPAGWLPPNSGFPVLGTGVVVSTASNQFDVDVRTAPISGTITFDGAAIAGCYLALRSVNAGVASFAVDATGAYSGRVLPETYDLVYIGGTTGTACPMNSSSMLKRGLVVPATGTTMPPSDVPSVAVAGKLTLGGAALGNSSDDGTLSLRTDAGDVIPLGKLSAGTFSIRVIPGNYDLYFDLTNPLFTQLAPLNPHGKIKSVVLAAGASITLDIDVPSTVISGTVKIGGNFLDKEYDGGRLWLGDPKTNVGIPLAWTSTGKYSARVLPGTYDLYYQGTSPSALAPFNAAAKLGCFVVQ